MASVWIERRQPSAGRTPLPRQIPARRPREHAPLRRARSRPGATRSPDARGWPASSPCAACSESDNSTTRSARSPLPRRLSAGALPASMSPTEPPSVTASSSTAFSPGSVHAESTRSLPLTSPSSSRPCTRRGASGRRSARAWPSLPSARLRRRQGQPRTRSRPRPSPASGAPGADPTDRRPDRGRPPAHAARIRVSGARTRRDRHARR
jgi:hypothetical protein